MPKEFSRLDRIADVMQKEIAQLIQRELRDPRISMMTISHIKVSKDLSHAKVYVSVMHEEKAEETIATLNRAAGFLRGALAKRIQLRIMPALNFVYDDTNIRANRLSRLIDEAVKSDQRTPDEEKE